MDEELDDIMDSNVFIGNVCVKYQLIFLAGVFPGSGTPQAIRHIVHHRVSTLRIPLYSISLWIPNPCREIAAAAFMPRRT